MRQPLRRSAQRLPSWSELAGGGKYWEEVREAPHCGPEAPQAPAIPTLCNYHIVEDTERAEKIRENI